jgi:DUF1680 family protein
MESSKKYLNSLKPNIFSPLPLGSIKPLGWLKKQLNIQADGLTGHIDEFWEDLGPNNKWLGGDKEGWERGPYYADGLVPLAYLLDDEKLKKKAKIWIDAFLDSQDENGWIGPKESAEKRYELYDPWPVFIVLKVLTQYYEISRDNRIIEVMNNFFRYLKKDLKKRPLFSWGKFRWAELVLSIHWLYEQTEEDWLLKLAEIVSKQGYNWQKHFTDFEYTKKSTETKLENHVVNNAMGIKASAVWFRQSGKNCDREAVCYALENLNKFHGQATGVFSGDEHLAGKNPSQGTELCAVVEYMFSLEILISIFGDPKFTDYLEMITFNALPATFKPDMWAHQYDQQVNQVICNIAERNWTNNGSDSNIFGLKPEFGCCAANMHQGWPKYVKSLWMATDDNGLAAIAYSPCKVTTVVGDSKEITIIEETDYPFGDKIVFKIEGVESVLFPISFRIPSWAKHARVKLPNGEIKSPESGSFYKVKRKWHPGDVVEIRLPMEIRTERRYMGSVAIYRGPLVYSLRIGEDWKLIGGTPPHGDWEVYPTTLWNYGLKLDTNNLVNSIQVNLKSLNNMPFSPEGSPVELMVKGRILPNWKLEGNCAGPIPQSPVKSHEKLEELTLIPYGCTNLRVTEFPLLYD